MKDVLHKYSLSNTKLLPIGFWKKRLISVVSITISKNLFSYCCLGTKYVNIEITR